MQLHRITAAFHKLTQVSLAHILWGHMGYKQTIHNPFNLWLGEEQAIYHYLIKGDLVN